MLAWRKRRWTPILNFAAEMPYALPGVVLAIACLLMFLKPLPVVGVSLYNSLWIILLPILRASSCWRCGQRLLAFTRLTVRWKKQRALQGGAFLSLAHHYIPSCRPGDACRRRAHFHDRIL